MAIVKPNDKIEATTQNAEKILSFYGKMIDDRLANLFGASDFPVETATLYKAERYSLMSGGKRIRPVLVLSVCHMLGGNPSVALDYAAAVEMIHTYSLVHDDLPAMDNDALRRGLPTVHVKFGEDMAILAGDALLNFAFETACQGFAVKPGDANVEKAFAVLAKKAGIYGMVGGQVLDVERAGLPMDEDQLAFIYENKTGALIAAACMCGAYLAGADDAVVAQLDEAAYAVGFAFQVQDDILDLVGDEQLLGKPLHSDDKNHKVTYVTLHGMDAAKQYVEEMSEKAIRILENIKAWDEGAKADMIALVKSLINRDH